MNTMTEMIQKVAVRFAKSGSAIYHSHHDLIRFWERAVKRAQLPVRCTQGFNPRPRIIFPHALGVGIRSRHEEVELELHQLVPLDEIIARLRTAVDGTLEIIDAFTLPPVKKSRQVQACSYSIGNWPEGAAEALSRFAADCMSRREICVERGAPGEKRVVDIRPYLLSLAYDAAGAVLTVDLKHTPTGSGRPDEIARLAAEAARCDCHALTLEKTAMTLD